MLSLRKLARPLLVLSLAAPAAFAQSTPPPPPSEVPAPPSRLPPPPDVQQAPQPGPVAAPSGQWVHTDQYGWVWMPYGESYVYTPPQGEPSMFVYYPAFGWRWVAAPWVWHVGPAPYFGYLGPTHFVWYGPRRYYRPYRYHSVAPYRYHDGPRFHRHW